MLFAARVLVCVLAPLAGSLRTEQAEGECETTTVPAQTEACFEKRPAWSDGCRTSWRRDGRCAWYELEEEVRELMPEAGDSRCVANCVHPDNQRGELCDPTMCWWDALAHTCTFLPTEGAAQVRLAVCGRAERTAEQAPFCADIAGSLLYVNALAVAAADVRRSRAILPMDWGPLQQIQENGHLREAVAVQPERDNQLATSELLLQIPRMLQDVGLYVKAEVRRDGARLLQDGPYTAVVLELMLLDGAKAAPYLANVPYSALEAQSRWPGSPLFALGDEGRWWSLRDRLAVLASERLQPGLHEHFALWGLHLGVDVLGDPAEQRVYEERMRNHLEQIRAAPTRQQAQAPSNRRARLVGTRRQRGEGTPPRSSSKARSPAKASPPRLARKSKSEIAALQQKLQQLQTRLMGQTAQQATAPGSQSREAVLEKLREAESAAKEILVGMGVDVPTLANDMEERPAALAADRAVKKNARWSKRLRRWVSQRIRTQGVHVDPMAGPPPPSVKGIRADLVEKEIVSLADAIRRIEKASETNSVPQQQADELKHLIDDVNRGLAVVETVSV